MKPVVMHMLYAVFCQRIDNQRIFFASAKSILTY